MKRTIIKQNVGIDIAKDDFKVSFHQGFSDGSRKIKGSRAFKNSPTGFKQLIKWVDKIKIINVELRILLEATGVYHENLTYFLADNTDYRISVILPNKSKNYFKSLNIKTKTDKIDAKYLGQMGLEQEIEQWMPSSDAIRNLKQLSRSPSTLIDSKTRASNQLHAMEHSFQVDKTLKQLFKQQIRLLEKQIAILEIKMKEAVETDELLSQQIANITEVKGLNLISVVSVIAETDGFNLFTSIKQLTSYAGYDVVQKQSGTSVNGQRRISKKGNAHIRKALYFPALTAVRFEEEFKELFNRIFERTRIKMKGYVAVQRKLLILIYTLFKKQEKYNSIYYKSIKTKQKESEKNRQTSMPAYAG